MAFSPGQHGEITPLARAAWKLHCQREGVSIPFDTFRRDELEKATGKRSTGKCSSGRDFEKAAAHFEELAEDGIKWQLRLLGGDLRRARHAIEKINPDYLKQFKTDAAFQEYLEGIAVQANHWTEPVPLYRLTNEQVSMVTRSACIAAARAKTS